MNPDIKTIRIALRALPGTCKYHGEKLDPPDSWHEACCDTGIPALRRRHAEAALKRLETR